MSKAEAAIRARLSVEGLKPSSWSNEAHDHYSEHRHDYDKVLVAAAGSIVFHLVELARDVELRTGDRLELPARTLHGAEVGGDGVACLEAQLPAGTVAAEPLHTRGWWSSEA